LKQATVAAVAVALSLLSGCEGGTASDGIDPRNAAQVARGRAVYDRHCASCHGAKLEGQPNWRERLPNGRLPAPPHDDSGHTWHHPNAQLFALVKNGLVPPNAPQGYESDMPAYKSILSDDDIRAVLAYIESHWGKDVWAARRDMERQRKN
jgi:mono/diheme cytochrome c family protein